MSFSLILLFYLYSVAALFSGGCTGVRPNYFFSDSRGANIAWEPISFLSVQHNFSDWDRNYCGACEVDAHDVSSVAIHVLVWFARLHGVAYVFDSDEQQACQFSCVSFPVSGNAQEDQIEQ